MSFRARRPPVSTTGSWRKLHLPHDFVVEGKFDEKTSDPAHGFLPKGVGWYRKTFEIPASDRGKTLWIDFDGVFRNCRVWLNGRLLGRHRSGYTSFRYYITEAAHYGGTNVLAVRVDARGHEGWWYEGGGIYRHVGSIRPIHCTWSPGAFTWFPTPGETRRTLPSKRPLPIIPKRNSPTP